MFPARPTSNSRHPIRGRIDLGEEPAEQISIVAPDVVVLPSASGSKYRASVRMHAKRPVHDTHRAQPSPREPCLLGRPPQRGLRRGESSRPTTISESFMFGQISISRRAEAGQGSALGLSSSSDLHPSLSRGRMARTRPAAVVHAPPIRRLSARRRRSRPIPQPAPRSNEARRLASMRSVACRRPGP